jgi:hypothetical protein
MELSCESDGHRSSKNKFLEISGNYMNVLCIMQGGISVVMS